MLLTCLVQEAISGHPTFVGVTRYGTLFGAWLTSHLLSFGCVCVEAHLIDPPPLEDVIRPSATPTFHALIIASHTTLKIVGNITPLPTERAKLRYPPCRAITSSESQKIFSKHSIRFPTPYPSSTSSFRPRSSISYAFARSINTW
jgi:hypothetical protein